MMQIHLAKPGGERQGPFTLDQINQDLSARKYRDTDFWAWYDGADAWVPLYSVPGILQSEGAHPASQPPRTEKQPAQRAPAPAQQQAKATRPLSDEDRQNIAQLASGMPFDALKQIFVFTSGEGPALMQSPLTVALIESIVGEKWPVIREKVPRDVFGRCDIGATLRQQGKIPEAAWRAMSALKPDIVQQAKTGALRTTVRTFSIEDGETAAVFLFYAKQ